MAKRLTDTTIWKKQRWFKKLSPIHKLAWKYITDTCDHAGILAIDFSEFVDDLGVEEFDISNFITCCNTDFDKENGKKIVRERVKMVKKNVVWLTGFVKFQYENKDFLINPSIPAVYSALTILNGYGALDEGLSKGYLTLSQPYLKGMLRTKDKDKDKDKDIKERGAGEGKQLCPEMLRTFKHHLPNYGEDISRDYEPILSIAKYIFKHGKWQGDFLANQKNISKSWEGVCLWISKDSFYSQKSLKTISSHIQEIINKNKNGINGKHNNQAKFGSVGKSLEFDQP